MNEYSKMHFHLSETYNKGCEKCGSRLVEADGTRLFIRRICSNCKNIEIFSTLDGRRVSEEVFLRSLILSKRRRA